MFVIKGHQTIACHVKNVISETNGSVQA